MSDEAHIPSSDPAAWQANYFNYFTEIEEHFQRARGTSLFLLSPLDWALIESWKNAGVPLQAVLGGIDDAFTKWRGRRQKRQMVNSIVYCAQAVLEAAQRAPASRESRSNPAAAPFSADELSAHLNSAATAIRARPPLPFQEIATSLESLSHGAAEHLGDLESLERRLTALEEKLVAALRSLLSDTELYALRERLDAELKPYRSKMTADQLALLERRYLDSALLERAALPRLSLFYLH